MITISDDAVKRMDFFWFLGSYISKDLCWTIKSSALIKKAKQRQNCLQVSRRHHLKEKLLYLVYKKIRGFSALTRRTFKSGKLCLSLNLQNVACTPPCPYLFILTLSTAWLLTLLSNLTSFTILLCVLPQIPQSTHHWNVYNKVDSPSLFTNQL